ncbi:unnamed protein product [Cylindrotheca closterium]|uniref:Glycosyl transferase family 25 domain-containing protein n=1 Tax=Cylindrotheca closterium TaxID=2856 RepID=A0AAD2FFY7_9STRA|nr:unnamed protein product [Cylindrotheca closterium]
MSSSAESSRYVPPHRRQPPNGHHSSPATISTRHPQTTTTTPHRFHNSWRQTTPQSYRTPNKRVRPRDNSSSLNTWPSSSASFSTPPRNHVGGFSSSGLSAASPVWTPAALKTKIITETMQSMHHDDHDPLHSQAMQAQSLFTRIVCINLIKRQDRWTTFQKRMRNSLNQHCAKQDWGNHPFLKKVERFAAVDGQAIMHLYDDDDDDKNDDEQKSGSESLVLTLPLLEWDATQNAQYDRHIQPPMTKQMTPGEVGCALSHIQLWNELKEMQNSSMLILEDDAILYEDHASSRRHGSKGKIRQPQPGNHHHHHHHHHYKNGHGGRYSDSFSVPNWRNSARCLDASFESVPENESSSSSMNGGGGFIQALLDVEKIVPKDWDILYLGLSDRGERKYIPNDDVGATGMTILPVTLFRPTYGFHTHAYALTQKAASVLLENLPVQGPLDVWLADNKWFGLNVYCASIQDGTNFWGKEGAQLVSQQRHNNRSDIVQSGRASV